MEKTEPTTSEETKASSESNYKKKIDEEKIAEKDKSINLTFECLLQKYCRFPLHVYVYTKEKQTNFSTKQNLLIVKQIYWQTLCCMHCILFFKFIYIPKNNAV